MRSVIQFGARSTTHHRYAVLCMLALVLGMKPARAQSSDTDLNTSAASALPNPTAARPSIASSQAAPTAIVQPSLPAMPPVQGIEIDRMVAIVNGELILDSDVDQERRFTALLPNGADTATSSRGEALDRLINRDLILQQVQLQPGAEITMDAARKNLDELRTSIPQCKEYQCQTDAGWTRFLASEGFTEQSLLRLWQQRMEVIAFIEERFRMGITISPDQIKTYYQDTMLPQYKALHAAPPPVASISRGIRQVLLQQQVSKLLDTWLQSLRAQGSVVVLHPAEDTP